MKEAEAKGGMSFGDQVLGVLHQMVLSGSSSAEDVARLFGVHERTLRRRLANEGKSLHELIQQTRFELAQQLLENTEIPVTGIAAALRYEDPNAFSRAFRSGWQKPSAMAARPKGSAIRMLTTSPVVRNRAPVRKSVE